MEEELIPWMKCHHDVGKTLKKHEQKRQELIKGLNCHFTCSYIVILHQCFTTWSLLSKILITSRAGALAHLFDFVTFYIPFQFLAAAF